PEEHGRRDVPYRPSLRFSFAGLQAKKGILPCQMGAAARHSIAISAIAHQMEVRTSKSPAIGAITARIRSTRNSVARRRKRRTSSAARGSAVAFELRKPPRLAGHGARHAMTAARRGLRLLGRHDALPVETVEMRREVLQVAGGDLVPATGGTSRAPASG